MPNGKEKETRLGKCIAENQGAIRPTNSGFSAESLPRLSFDRNFTDPQDEAGAVYQVPGPRKRHGYQTPEEILEKDD